MMHIVFDHVYFAYESFGRNGKTAPPADEEKLSEGSFALRDISFELSSTECLAILGRSGSGKSTLMNLFTGLVQPSRGRIAVDSQDIFASTFPLSAVRQRLGLVFQFPESQLFELTLYNDVAFGPRNLGLAESVVKERVEKSLEAVGLPLHDFAEVDPMHLSQGEKRRAAIAGILAMQPEMLIMDEPTAGLDAAGQEMLITMLDEFRGRGMGLVLISHDTSLACHFARRAIVLDAGRLLYDGDLLKILSDQNFVRKQGLEIPRTMRLAELMRQHNISALEIQMLLQDNGAVHPGFSRRSARQSASLPQTS